MNADDEKSYQRVVTSLLGGVMSRSITRAINEVSQDGDWKTRARLYTAMFSTEMFVLLERDNGITDSVKKYVEDRMDLLQTDDAMDALFKLIKKARYAAEKEKVDLTDHRDVTNFAVRFSQQRDR